MTQKKFGLLLFVLITLACSLMFLLYSVLKDSTMPTYLIKAHNADIHKPIHISSVEDTTYIIPSATPTKAIDTIDDYASITIQTDKRTKSFDIYPDVKEQTLNKHIGHLPSSVRPGESGLCVLMGHRDRELKVLKYANIGDVLTIQKSGIAYRYRVTSIDIQDNNVSLIFPVAYGSRLAIVTCYPFDFFGPAPQRMIIYGKMQ